MNLKQKKLHLFPTAFLQRLLFLRLSPFEVWFTITPTAIWKPVSSILSLQPSRPPLICVPVSHRICGIVSAFSPVALLVDIVSDFHWDDFPSWSSCIRTILLYVTLCSAASIMFFYSMN